MNFYLKFCEFLLNNIIDRWVLRKKNQPKLWWRTHEESSRAKFLIKSKSVKITYRVVCNICGAELNSVTKYTLTKHLSREKHRSAAKHKQFQTSLDKSEEENAFDSRAVFQRELITMMLAANIPLKKLRHPMVRRVLNKYAKYELPSETTARDKTVPLIFSAIYSDIKERFVNKKVWISIDETRDRADRFVGGVVLRIIDDPEQEPYMFKVLELESVNGKSVAKAVDGILEELGVKRENVVMFVTDGAPYMKVAGRILKIWYRNMIHITCLAHSLHRLAEYIRSQFKQVDRLIALAKKVFLLSTERKNVFRNAAPNTPLPPKPVITRWGTWMEAVHYYV